MAQAPSNAPLLTPHTQHLIDSLDNVYRRAATPRENYIANKLWFETVAVPKLTEREQFMKEARKKQFKHVHASEVKIRRPAK